MSLTEDEQEARCVISDENLDFNRLIICSLFHTSAADIDRTFKKHSTKTL